MRSTAPGSGQRHNLGAIFGGSRNKHGFPVAAHGQRENGRIVVGSGWEQANFLTGEIQNVKMRYPQLTGAESIAQYHYVPAIRKDARMREDGHYFEGESIQATVFGPESIKLQLALFAQTDDQQTAIGQRLGLLAVFQHRLFLAAEGGNA